MSSRQLRKLQKQKELQAQNPINDDESSDDDQPAQKPRASMFSGFAALEGQDDENDDDDDERDEKEDESTEARVNPTIEPVATHTSKSPSKKSKKKKKKAKKQASISTKTEPVPKNGPDEIDQALRELELSRRIGQESNNTHSMVKPYERICELLSINTYHLRVINEMRNLFGREAIAAAQNDEEEEQARARRQRQGLQQQVDLETFLKAQPGKSLPEVTLRRNPFLSGKETWPQASTEGLTMRQIREEEKDAMPGTVEFCFTHDAKYNLLEQKFFELVQMYDPMPIVHFLHLHPYHISSLIQVSRVAKQDQNSALSADLCERALFTFGRVSLSAFRQKIEQGKARLSFRRPENRQFWLAGYHYLKNLIMKGTYRTALEWAKLLFGINHDDPYGIIHFIHPLAIRAHESKWFIDFCDSEILDRDAATQEASNYIRQTLILARLQQNDTAGAKALLVEGIEQLPWLYSNLFKSLNLDVPKAIWGMQPRSRDEELHTNVYIHQTKGLWDNAHAISLLNATANQMKRVDVNTKSPLNPSVTISLARFVYLLEIPSLIGLVPRELLNTSVNWEFDPLPPPLSENTFSHASQAHPFDPSPPGLGGILNGDRQELRHILNQARLAGAPEHFQREIEEAIQEAMNEAGGNGDDGEEIANEANSAQDGESGGGFMGVFRAFMELFEPHDGEPRRRVSDSEVDSNRDIPGGWRDLDFDFDEDEPDESDGEMPPLIPSGEGNNDANGHGNGENHANDDTDDEMPGLL